MDSGRYERIAFGVVGGLVCLKIAASAVTGSLSILAQLMDGLLDLIAVGLGFLSVRVATRPADEEHPFGHGKAENISAVVQAIFIFAAGISIIYWGVDRLLHGAEVAHVNLGIGVMAVSLLASLWLSHYLLRRAQGMDSLALTALAYNIRADVYSAGAVILGLSVVSLTGLVMADAVIALAMGVLVLRTGFHVLRDSFGGLMDMRLPQEEEEIIRQSLASYQGEIEGFHHLRTRKAGNMRFIDLHLVVPKDKTVEEAHEVCDELEGLLKERLPHSSITIHVEPSKDSKADDE